jgi:hypothetical protein
MVDRNLLLYVTNQELRDTFHHCNTPLLPCQVKANAKLGEPHLCKKAGKKPQLKQSGAEKTRYFGDSLHAQNRSRFGAFLMEAPPGIGFMY